VTRKTRNWNKIPSVRRMFVAITLALILGNLASTGNAQTAPQALPKAEQILDRYIEAIGGLAAMEKINNRVTKGTMDVPAAGVKLSITVYSARPNKSYTVIESAATGKIENGSDGEVAWQISATSGPQVFEGKEKASQLHLNIFDRLAQWRKIFKQVETTGMEDVAGKSCYKVVATPPDLAPQTLFFDKDSGLLVKLSMTSESQMGPIPVESFPSDYQPVDGILMPRKNVIKTVGPERVATVDSIEHNVNLPPDRFALPAEIKALIKKKP
jgi:hypothetical protein